MDEEELAMPNINHGIIAGYGNGCRGPKCRAAKNAAAKKGRTERKLRLAIYPDLPIDHGRYTTYNNWGCRCDLCVGAYHVYETGLRERQQVTV